MQSGESNLNKLFVCADTRTHTQRQVNKRRRRVEGGAHTRTEDGLKAPETQSDTQQQITDPYQITSTTQRNGHQTKSTQCPLCLLFTTATWYLLVLKSRCLWAKEATTRRRSAEFSLFMSWILGYELWLIHFHQAAGVKYMRCLFKAEHLREYLREQVYQHVMLSLSFLFKKYSDFDLNRCSPPEI